MKMSLSTERYIKTWFHFKNVPEELETKILKHAKKYNLKPEICAIYDDMNDFYSDWCSIGYTKKEARDLFDTNEGHQFKCFAGYGIFRFEF